MQANSATINEQNIPGYKRVWKAITGWFTGLNRSAKKIAEQVAGPVNETAHEKTLRELRQRMDNALNEFKDQTSLNVDGDKLSNAINKFQLHEAIKLDAKGVEDGIKGVRDTRIAADTKARAAFIVEHTTSILSGKQKALEKELEHKKETIEGFRENLRAEKAFSNKLSGIQKTEYRHFFKPMAWFYIIMGICMMIADFPISLGIAIYFIDVPVDFDGNFLSKINNPEILLFSLGITFLSIYFKIYYDEYINRSIIKPDNPPTVKSLFNVDAVVGFVFKTTVLIMLLFLLYKLGNMRNALNQVSIDSKYPDLVSKPEIFNYKLVSFIVTTMLLPVISGICLSVGLGVLSNCANLDLSYKKIDRLLNNIHAAELELTNLETIESTIEALNKDWQKNAQSKLADLANLFESYYLQGFKKGHRAQFGFDIYANANALYIDSLTTLSTKQ